MKKTILLAFILSFYISLDIQAQIPLQDSLALVALYDSADGANWTDNTNWLSGDVSTWYGVTVSEERVTRIDLSYNNLVGSIPPEIGNLTSLTKLALRNNQFMRPIPPELGNLANLTELNLSFSQIPDAIPRELANLIKLEYLYLPFNQLEGAIPPELGNLVNLIVLDLSSNQLTSDIPVELCNLATLQVLALNNNRLEGGIPPEIGNLANLIILNLYQNQLSGSIPPEIGNLLNLTDLQLTSNSLIGNIPPEIGNLTNLYAMSLYYNQLAGTIPPEIGNLTNLTYINLHSNQLEGPVPVELFNLTNLESLTLYGNNLTDTIPSQIGNLTKLKTLRLQENKFTGPIPQEITGISQLEEFKISCNYFTDLPDLSSDTSLSTLEIQNNQFSFEDIEPNIFVSDFTYSPQDSVGEKQDTTINVGANLTLSITTGGTANEYQWMKNGVDISGTESNIYQIDSVVEADAGSYVCKITNTIATELTLYSRTIKANVTGTVGVMNQTDLKPNEFKLHQNFPNPFNPSTVIQYDLSKSVLVNISIYNMLGQTVKILDNDFQQAGD